MTRPLRRAALLICLTLLAACRDGAVQDGPAVLEWGTVEYTDVQRVIECATVVKARDQALVRVGSRVGGQISRMFVKTGDWVRRGQLLALIDDRELQTLRRQAEARLEAAQSELSRVEATTADRLAQERARLAGNQGRKAYAEKNLERKSLLRGQGHITGDQYDSARRDAATTARTVEADTSAVARVAGETRADLAKARRQVEEAKAAMDFIDVRIGLTRIESPIEGSVAQVISQAGEQVVAELEAVNIVSILDPRFLELWVYVNEADVAGVRPGMRIRFYKASAPGDIREAVVSRVSPVPDVQDRVRFYPAIATLSLEAAATLRPEMNLQSLVLVEDVKGVLSVPAQAVFVRGAKREVYMREPGGGVRVARPRFGVFGNTRIQILDGLASGDRVAVKIDTAGR